MPKRPHAWVAEHRLQLGLVRREDFPGDGEVPSREAGERSHASNAKCNPLRTAATPTKSILKGPGSRSDAGKNRDSSYPYRCRSSFSRPKPWSTKDWRTKPEGHSRKSARAYSSSSIRKTSALNACSWSGGSSTPSRSDSLRTTSYAKRVWALGRSSTVGIPSCLAVTRVRLAPSGQR